MSDPLEDAALSPKSYASTRPIATDTTTTPCTAANAVSVNGVI